MKGIGAKLKAAREAEGLSIAEISKRTRIDPDHLLAIEAERWDVLPEGPYRDAWVKAYCRLVRVPSPVRSSVPEFDGGGVPLWVPRLAGLVAVFAVLLLIGWQLLAPKLASPPKKRAQTGPDQKVTVYTRRNAQITVRADGEVVFDKMMTGDESRTFRARDRIEIDVPSVEIVRLNWNEVSYVPQGRQDTPRTLVFIDDGE